MTRNVFLYCFFNVFVLVQTIIIKLGVRTNEVCTWKDLNRNCIIKKYFYCNSQI